jgi:hypothetical protein
MVLDLEHSSTSADELRSSGIPLESRQSLDLEHSSKSAGQLRCPLEVEPLILLPIPLYL